MQTEHNKKGMEDQDKNQVPTDRHFDNFNEDNKTASGQEEKDSEQNDGQQANDTNDNSANNG